MPKEFWYTTSDPFTEGLQFRFKVKNILHQERSSCQFIEVLDTYPFGKMLLIDHIVMLTERDEHAYHEMLIHPAMVVHPEPKNILVIGGGDGGSIREILKYEVSKIILVDIDQRVIEVSMKYFPELSSGFKDPRVEVINADGAEWVKSGGDVGASKGPTFDIIFIDSTDPVGPGAKLVEKDFLENGAHLLKSDGIWVAQSESPYFHQSFIKNYTHNLRENFLIVRLYLTEVPSYSGVWSFTFGSNKIDPLLPRRLPPKGLCYYNPALHRASFSLPEYLMA